MLNADSGTVMYPDTTLNTLSENTVVASAYVPTEGDVTQKNGKVMVWRNNDLILADNDI
ncbi:MAG: hypothetical protein ABIY51_15950 [Ferruginibacter sp.]